MQLHLHYLGQGQVPRSGHMNVTKYTYYGGLPLTKGNVVWHSV